MNKTGIEYLDFTWNPIAMRCTPVSEGCTHCWHLAMCNRMKSNPKLSARERCVYGGECAPFLMEHRLDAPLKRKKHARIGVQFMGDLFYEDVKTEDIYRIIVRMEEAKQHTFLILTKRPKRMLELMNNPKWFAENPHIWLGVTAENQARADDRIPILLQIPAAVRFISYEPALGPLTELYEYLQWNQLHWVIAGCESGPGRRPAKIEWFRDLKDQCVEAEIPFFLKQCEVEFGNGKLGIEKRPMLDGRVWDQLPG